MNTTTCDRCSAKIPRYDLMNSTPDLSIDIGQHDYTADGRNRYTFGAKNFCIICRKDLVTLIETFFRTNRPTIVEVSK